MADPDPQHILERGKQGDASKCTTCHYSLHNNVPEPPLTPWAKRHLVVPNQMQANAILHDTPLMPARRTNCDPVGVPAQFWHAQFAPFEFVMAHDRVFQFFESHREWRTIWTNRHHPQKLVPTYMGDSIGKWDGDVLVIDTIGYNGKSLVEPVEGDHATSDAFHLVERWRRVAANNIELSATYYDRKEWGDKPWTGLNMEFVRQNGMQLSESYCSREENKAFRTRGYPAFYSPSEVNPIWKP